MPNEAKDVMLVFPHPGTVAADFALSLVSVTRDPTRIAGIADLRTGPFMSGARNDLAGLFLASGLEWLWMVDADMVFNEHTLPAMLAWADPEEVPLLGAYCWAMTRDGAMVVTAYRADKDDNGRFGLSSLIATDLPDNSLVKVEATGAACLLAHRTVFTRINTHTGTDQQWFNEQTIDGRPFGEDLSFCLRAGAAGIPLYVHTGIQAGHMRDMQLGQVHP